MTIFNYTVNYIDVFLVAIFLIFSFIGYKKGLLMTVVNFIRYAVGFFLCFYCSDNLTQPIYDGYVKEKVLQSINEKITTSSNLDEILNNLTTYQQSLPKWMSEMLNIDSVSIPNSDDVAYSILQNVFEPVVLSIIKVLIFIVVFILFFLATGIIIKLMRKSSKRRENSRKARNKHTSLIVKIDRILGGLFGICKSFVIILAITSILMYILSLTGTVLETNNFLTEVQNSVLLKYINEINPFNAVTEGLI